MDVTSLIHMVITSMTPRCSKVPLRVKKLTHAPKSELNVLLDERWNVFKNLTSPLAFTFST